MPAVIAIDPGLTGAIALYQPEEGHLVVVDMPVGQLGKKTHVGLLPLWLLVDSLTGPAGVQHAVVEHVSAMPRQGLGSTFNFGKTAGACEMAVVAAGCELVRAPPQTWKFQVGLNAQPGADTKARKNASRALAQQLFPNHAHLFARVKDDGRAEAALMAWWFIHRRKQP